MRINGRAAARIGDAVDCGGTITEGSASVVIGNGSSEGIYKSVRNSLFSPLPFRRGLFILGKKRILYVKSRRKKTGEK